MLFCYGLVCRREHWRHQLNHFTSGYQHITFDYRAHQRSAIPTNSTHLTLEWCANDAEDLIRYLKLKEVVVMGHSMGVAVASLLGQRAKDVVKGLILVCGSVSNPFERMFNSDRMDGLFKIYATLFENAPNAMSLIMRKLTELNRLSFYLTARLGFNPYLAEEQDVLQYMEGVNSIAPSIFYSLITSYTQFDGRSDLPGIECPTLVISGTSDVLTPLKLQEEMAELIPKGILEKIPMGSHNAHMDLPDMVNHKIEEFLSHINYK